MDGLIRDYDLFLNKKTTESINSKLILHFKTKNKSTYLT